MLTRLFQTLINIGSTLLNKIRGFERRHWIGFTLIVIIVSFGAGYLFKGGNHDVSETTTQTREVTTATVAKLSSDSSPLPVVGKVTSVNEARIRTEGSGSVVTLYKKLGDYIFAGGVIAELGNSAERAAVLQAQGAYDAALAQQDITNISSGNAQSALTEAKTSSRNTLGSAYSNLDDAVRGKADQLFNNPRSTNPKLALTVSDSQLVISIEAERLKIESLLQAMQDRNQAITDTSDLISLLTQTGNDTLYIKQFFDDLTSALNKSVPTQSISQSTIDGFKLSISGARSSVLGILGSVSAAKDNLNAKTAQASIADKQGNTGGTSGGVKVAEAALTQALGNLRAAQARLEKTIIRSPISGTIISLNLDTGDIVSAFQDAAVVSNSGALEIVTSIGEEDAGQVVVGSNVTIEDAYRGVVTKVAPAIDPLTHKIEVRIGILDKQTKLINGQSVRLSITRNGNTADFPSTISIPISALKITPAGSIVFTVSTSSTLVAHPVTEGALLGEKILITSGLTPDMTIVTDARGLKDGMSVNVKNQ